MIATVSTCVELKVPPGRLWKALKDGRNFMPKAAPNFWSTWEVLEGDETTIGSLIQVSFNKSIRDGFKSRMRLVDFSEEEMYMTWESLPEEDPLYKQLRVTISVDPALVEEDLTVTMTDTSMVTWTVFYEPLGDAGPPSKVGRELLLRSLEHYLLTHDDYLVEMAPSVVAGDAASEVH